jgi:hypothetical protein
MPDIVDRLRELSANYRAIRFSDDSKLAAEAAAEIERLRDELLWIHQMLDRLNYSIPKKERGA